MRLGGFWGITGPMLVIATKQNGLESILPMLNAASSNREIITDLKSELVYLLHAIDKIPKKYFPPDNFPTIESFDKSIRYANGKLFAEGIDEQDFYMSLATGCVIYLLKKHSKSGTNFSLELKPVSGIDDPACIDNRLTVINKVKEIIKDDDFYLSNLTKVYRKVSKALQSSNEGIQDSNNDKMDYVALAKSFMLTEKVPENLIVDGSSLSFSPDELRVVEFFISSKGTIMELLSNLKVKEVVQNKIFGNTFREIVNRKPTALYWATQERFDIIKSKNNSSFLTSLLQEMKSDLQQFKNSMKTEVIPIKQYKSGDFSLDDVRYVEKVNCFSQEKQQFFLDILATGFIKSTDLVEDTFNLLSNIYDVVSGLNILGLNNFFDLNYTRSDWEKFIDSLNKLGICGINLFSISLYKASIGNMTFISNNFIKKSDEEIQAFWSVFHNIEDLVSTIKPIGEILTE